MILLHGLAADGGVMRGLGFDPLADGTDIVLAYPDGIDGVWNDNRPGVTSSIAHNEHVDDVGFLDSIVADATATQGVDPNRIGLIGFSNGGLMAAYYACLRADHVVAVATIAGAGGSTLPGSCRPSRPVSVFVIHSKRDPVVPYLGGPIAADHGTWGSSAPVPVMLDHWRRAAACRGVVDEKPRGVEPSLTVQRAFGCAGHTEVVLDRLDSPRHGWISTASFVTTDVVWQFVTTHLVPGA